MTEKHEVVPINEQFPVLSMDNMEVGELLSENLGGDGIDRFELERIKVGSGGAPGYVIVPPEEGAEVRQGEPLEDGQRALVIERHDDVELQVVGVEIQHQLNWQCQ